MTTVNWRTMPLWSLAVETRESVEPADLGDQVVHYSIPAVDSTGTGQVEATDSIKSAKLRLQGGEVLVSKLNPRKSRVLIVTDSPLPIVSSTEFVGLVPGRSLDSRYLAYFLQSESTRQVLDSQVQSVTRSHQRVSPEDVTHLHVPLPPLQEQHRIVDFLDAETTRIDSLAAMRERLVSLLEERMMASWSNVIDQDARDSTWSPIRRFITAITDGPFGSALTSSHYSDEGARVIRLGNLGRAEFRDRDPAYIPMEYFTQLRRHEALPGDLIVAGLGDQNHPLGRACMVPDDIGPAMVKADCFRLRLDQRRVLHEYAAWAMSSQRVADQVTLLARGSTRARINLEVARDIPIPVPPLERQRRSVAALRETRSSTRAITTRCRRQLDILAERRQALITAAVTGQFDVTTASGRNVTEGVAV
ncbi:restriction endonuclease subunit S [Streptomyces olivaceoviridis]|uniref:restriction endonuclease subunit S n=1 Tax=Streptomyces olivaceoviridis TaxID=1921 RepID=UPI00368C26DD